jgi:hypothetical protein
MAIWGGSVDWNSDGTAAGSGAIYNPSTDSWTPISSANAPAGGDGRWADEGERGVDLVWTGSRLIAIAINTQSSATGSWIHPAGAYDPQTGAWERIETAGAPGGRPYFAAWNGQKLFVAGSYGNDFAGLTYDFSLKRWTQVMSAVTGSFSGRLGTYAPEFGEIMVFGGLLTDGFDVYSGGSYGRRGFRLEH